MHTEKKKIIIIGGFLGAGKTTAILYMANHFIKSGKKIGIVTNDQGSLLVDTDFLRSNGLEVLSVEGGCFCCNFDEFTEKIAELKQKNNIDIILAEPVGSCTDLIATIFKPLQKNKAQMLGAFMREFSLAPLSIVADPKRIKRLMMEEKTKDYALGTEVNYLFDKQLQEAGIIAVNKCDTVTDSELEEIKNFLNAKYPGIELLCVSAKTGAGLNGWLSRITDTAFEPGQKPLEIDYEIYARAEAALGWLNTFCCLTAEPAGDVNGCVRLYMENVRAGLRDKNAEIAHLKCYCVAQSEYYKASITGIDDALYESALMSLPQKEINLIVNARVNAEPELLKQICESEIEKAFCGFKITSMHTESFKPAPPVPVHRLGNS